MFLMTNIKTKKPLQIAVVCSRTILKSKTKMSREAITPVCYFAFAGDKIKPSSFVPLKVFTFETTRPQAVEKQLQARVSDAKAMRSLPAKSRRVVLESQVLPELDRSAASPKDFYRLELMFPPEVIDEAARYNGPVDPHIVECKDIMKRNIINGLLRLLDPEPKYVLKSLKVLVGHRVDQWKRDRVTVLALILLLMVNNWKLKLENVPLKTKKLREFLSLVGCKIVNGTAILCREPRFETKRQLR